MTIDCMGCGSKSLVSLAVIVRDSHAPKSPEHAVATAFLRVMEGQPAQEERRVWRKLNRRNGVGICSICATETPELVDAWERAGIPTDTLEAAS